MRSARRWFLVALLVPALCVPGCNCIRTPASVRQEDEKRKQSKEEVARVDLPAAAPSPSASPGGTVFDVERRLEELRENFAAQRWESVRHDATALVTAGLDEVTKLEVLAMLLEALRETGDRERAREISDQFNKLYAALKTSERLAKDVKALERMNAMVARLKPKAANTDRFAEPEGEPRTSFKLAEKLRAGGDDEVMEHALPDGGTVYFSKSAAALESKVSGVSRDLAAAIQREPEFQYYFAIAEAAPPSGAPREKKSP